MSAAALSASDCAGSRSTRPPHSSGCSSAMTRAVPQAAAAFTATRARCAARDCAPCVTNHSRGAVGHARPSTACSTSRGQHAALSASEIAASTAARATTQRAHAAASSASRHRTAGAPAAVDACASAAAWSASSPTTSQEAGPAVVGDGCHWRGSPFQRMQPAQRLGVGSLARRSPTTAGGAQRGHIGPETLALPRVGRQVHPRLARRQHPPPVDRQAGRPQPADGSHHAARFALLTSPAGNRRNRLARAPVPNLRTDGSNTGCGPSSTKTLAPSPSRLATVSANRTGSRRLRAQ